MGGTGRLGGPLLAIAAAVAAATSAVPAAAQPAGVPECQFEPQPVAAPAAPDPKNGLSRFPGFASVVVRGASETTPVTVATTAGEGIFLTWIHMSSPSPAKLLQRLEVDVARPGDASRPYCATSWVPIDRLPVFGRLPLPASAPSRWTVRVFQRNLTPAVTVLDSDLASVNLVGEFDRRLSVDPRPLPYFDVLRAAPASPVPSCGVAAASDPDDAAPAAAADLSARALDVPGTLYALGGRRAFLRLIGLTGGQLRVTFLAKPVSYAWPAIPICTVTIAADAANAPARWVASVPWEAVSTLRWYVQVESAARPSPAVRLAVATDRTAPFPFAPNARPLQADTYGCKRKDTPRPDAAAARRMSFFQGAYALSVRTHLPAGVPEEARTRIVGALLLAIDNWRRSCVLCTPYQFSVIDIDGAVFVPESMLHGQPGDMRATFMARYPWNQGLALDKTGALFTSGTSFVAVDGSARQRSRFCIQRDEERYGFSARESPLCRPTTGAGGVREKVINLVWTEGDMGCAGGADPTDVVACWNQADIIRLNVRDFSFYAGDIGATLIGTAPRGADLIRVFTHEVGHWFGLGHLNEPGNIMSPRFGEARCIDDVALKRINDVAAGLAPADYGSEALLYE